MLAVHHDSQHHLQNLAQFVREPSGRYGEPSARADADSVMVTRGACIVGWFHKHLTHHGGVQMSERMRRRRVDGPRCYHRHPQGRLRQPELSVWKMPHANILAILQQKRHLGLRDRRYS